MTRPAHRPFTAALPRRRGNLSIVAPGPYPTTGDIDWIAVERAANRDYDPALLTDDEKREAALLMARAGVAHRAISTALCVYERLALQWLADEGLLPPERLCTREGCTSVRCGLGLCNVHLQALRTEQKRLAQEQMGEAA